MKCTRQTKGKSVSECGLVRTKHSYRVFILEFIPRRDTEKSSCSSLFESGISSFENETCIVAFNSMLFILFSCSLNHCKHILAYENEENATALLSFIAYISYSSFARNKKKIIYTHIHL